MLKNNQTSSNAQPYTKLVPIIGCAMALFFLLGMVVVYNYLHVNQSSFMHQELEYLADLQSPQLAKALKSKNQEELDYALSILQHASLIEAVELSSPKYKITATAGTVTHDASTIYKTLYSNTQPAEPIATLSIFPTPHHLFGLFIDSVKQSAFVTGFLFLLLLLLTFGMLDLNKYSQKSTQPLS